MDIPNIDCLSFPTCVDKALHNEKFKECKTYLSFEKLVFNEITKEIKRLVEYSKNVFIIPSP